MDIPIHTISLGCPKNLVDTEFLLGGLPGVAKPVDDPRKARVVLINTCGFIQPAVEESLQAILDAASAIADASPRPLLAVAGCLVSRYGKELAFQIPEVDLWLSTHELPDWPAKIAQALRLGPAPRPGRLLSGPPSYAYLKISEGCRHRCRFCAIPSIRGPLKSRPVTDLLPEARDILATGRRELILVAQDLTAYGRDLTPKQDLRSLLDGLLTLPGLERLRLLYLYPAGLTKTLLSFMAQAGPTLLPYFDIPLQHAHPDILKAMGRPFAQDPRAVLDRVRTFFPQGALRTSLIVGFPGERAAHFKSLMDFVAQAKFQHLGVFAYQAEEGTPAAKMPRQVPMAERQKRRQAVMALQAEISSAWLKEFEGQDLKVLVDAVSPEWPGLHLGRTWFQAPDIDGVTYVSGPGVAPGAMVKAEIVEAKTYDLVALTG
jgi:tRNA-2-methylthio-N6-dimethylallyladenosine synthase/ribosomal protein S12 methylthiotransferase